MLIKKLSLSVFLLISLTNHASDNYKQNGLASPAPSIRVERNSRQRPTKIQQIPTRIQELPQIEAQYVQIQATELTYAEFPQFITQAQLENWTDHRTKKIQITQQADGTQTVIITQRQDNCCETAINSLQFIVCCPISIAVGAWR